MTPPPLRCPCGTGLTYTECCGRWHSGEAAPTAEALMRSRFTAFAVGDVAYLLATWHPETRPTAWERDDVRWQRLDILSRWKGGPFDTEGTVEFEAFYRGGSQHENSAFTRVDGRWVYHSPVA